VNDIVAKKEAIQKCCLLIPVAMEIQ